MEYAIKIMEQASCGDFEPNSSAAFYSKLLHCLVNNHKALLFILLYFILYSDKSTIRISLLILSEYCINFISLYHNSWCDVCTDLTNLVNAKVDVEHNNHSFRTIKISRNKADCQRHASINNSPLQHERPTSRTYPLKHVR